MANDKPKILIVDDERFYINILVELLSDEYNTIVSKGGLQVFDRALDNPDLILLDIMMPDMDGYEVCRLLKDDSRTRDIPVIFLTVKSELDDEIYGFKLGAVDYISKPISPAIVKVRVATHIALNKARKSLSIENKLLIAEQKKKDEQLRCSQKLDALGKLTGGIAHDFNNILGIILGYSDLLMENISSDDTQLQKYTQQISSAGERGRKITQKLLSFSRKRSSKQEVININQLLKDQQHVLEKALTISIDILLNLDANIWKIIVDKSELEDAILNMCINSMYAMPSGGTLKLQTNNESVSSEKAKQLNIKPGEYVKLTVDDNGAGMELDVVDKIFEPLFSTKGEQGTGLGMSQVYSFVKRSSGAISVHSEPGIGTQIRLYFPRNTSSEKDTDMSNGQSITQDYTGTETILLVDDEKPILELNAKLLEGQGYNVFQALNAEQALKIIPLEKPDLMLIDIVLPGMDGYELAAIVCDKYPDIKLQILTGYNDANTDTTSNAELYHDALKKPIQSIDLLRHIRGLLDSNN
ncbi:MAG: response regulator [Gammaproteobacteria bacterium]|nr:response regulator [Gammaproteobacteria bacterium]